MIDGQHRLSAARHAAIAMVPCLLVPPLSPADQAKLFTGVNAQRVNMTPQALHRARLAAGDVEAVRLDSVCRSADVVILPWPKTVGQGLKPNETLMVTRLYQVFKKYGPDVLRDILQGIRRAYPTTPGKINAQILKERINRYEMKQLYGDDHE